MTYEEFVSEYLEMVKEIPDDADESVLVSGFLNEQAALCNFSLPLEELLVVLKHVKPAIAGYIDLIASRDVKRLFKSEMTLEQALERLGARPDFFV